MISIDTETTGPDFLRGCRPFMIGISDGQYNYIWDAEIDPYTRRVYWLDSDKKEIQDVLNSHNEHIFHNANFDIEALRSIGIEIDPEIVHDTMLMAHTVCSGDKLGLKYLALKYLDYPDDDEKELQDEVKRQRELHPDYDLAVKGHRCFPGESFNGAVGPYVCDYWLAQEECTKYLCGDIERTLLLFKIFKEYLISVGNYQPYLERLKLLPVTYDMKQWGLTFFEDRALSGIEEIEEDLEQINDKLTKMVVNYTFPDCQMIKDWEGRNNKKKVFYDIYKFPVVQRTDKSEEPATCKNTVAKLLQREDLSREQVLFLKAYRERIEYVSELKYSNIYIAANNNGRIHSNTHIAGTRTTRRASRGPNQQNIGKGFLKSLYGPIPGRVWMDLDFENIEMRIWAYHVNNPEFVEAFDNGKSVHLLVAEELYPELMKQHGTSFKDIYKKTYYQWIKNGNFARIYGATKRKGDDTYHVKGACDKLDPRFPEIEKWIQESIKLSEENYKRTNRCEVKTIVGDYPLAVPPRELFAACDYRTQGAKGVVVAHAMIAVHNYLYQDLKFSKNYNEEWSAGIGIEVHDSLIIDLPDTTKVKEQIIPDLANVITTTAENYVKTCPIEYNIISYPNKWS